MKRIDVTGIVFYDEENKFLMQLRDKNAKVYPNHWGLFGGKINKNEKSNKSIEREIFEELNFKLKNYEYLFCDTYKLEGVSYGNWFTYIKKISEDEKKLMKLQEGADWGWFSHTERKDLLINDEMFKVLEKVYQIIINKNQEK
ncbi:MAG: NUDIX domain-containing protein [Nanoarchaeota archaeon]|nr:NUDIX domain-containing protein [Nanoarchaeota archaeon]MCA9497070.1 NUDIX domain-containing protein [Nanoarchaeota archaeon]